MLLIDGSRSRSFSLFSVAFLLLIVDVLRDAEDERRRWANEVEEEHDDDDDEIAGRGHFQRRSPAFHGRDCAPAPLSRARKAALIAPARAPLPSPLARHGLFKRVGAHSLGRQTRQALRRGKERWERDEEDCKLVHNLLARSPTKPNQISPYFLA